jgi:Bacterial regulatory proteins, luxR family
MPAVHLGASATHRASKLHVFNESRGARYGPAYGCRAESRWLLLLFDRDPKRGLVIKSSPRNHLGDSPTGSIAISPSYSTCRCAGITPLREQSKNRCWFLDISDAAVKVHITHILKKLKVTGRPEAINVAVRRGLVHMDPLAAA